MTSSAHYCKRILAASGNSNKIAELATVADEYGLLLLTPQQVIDEQELAPPPKVEETAETYYGNALLKAQAYTEWSGLPSLADDSGLEVSALDGRPGVRSARYAGEDTPHSLKMEKLLAELAEARNADRSARFYCSIVLAYPNGALLSAEGELRGRVLEAPRGNGGFGYDPIICIDSLGKTLAEVDFSVTCDIGFRSNAARRLFDELCSLKKVSKGQAP